MTYGTQVGGNGYIHLTAEENARFKAGKPVIKETGDANGMVVITLKMTRPKSRAKRFPEAIYGKDYKPSKNPEFARIVGGQVVGVHKP